MRYVIQGFGEKFRKLRLSKNLTQKQLGEIVGLAASTVNHYEVGYSQPRLPELVRICSNLGVSSDYLLGLG